MTRLLASIASIALGVTTSCATPPTLPAAEYQVDADADFSALRAYAWAASTGPLLGDDRIDERALDDRIRKTTDATLSAAGFTKVELEQAEFLVAYSVHLEDRVFHFDDLPRKWGGRPADYHYEVGTLEILMADPATEHLLWSGTLQSEVSPDSPGVRVERAVARILEGFPPR